jgi:gas vesicle protein
MAENQNNGIGVGTALLTFTLGAVIGGGLALLTAPRSGPETRKKLHGMVDETREKLSEMTRDAETRIKKVAQEGKDMLEENAELIKAAVNAGKEAMAAEKAKHQKSA